jgi:hypothetical protein
VPAATSTEPRRHNNPAQRAGFLKSQRVRAESPVQKMPAKKHRRSHAAAPLALMIYCRRAVGAPPAVPVFSHPSNIAKLEPFQKGIIRLMTMGANECGESRGRRCGRAAKRFNMFTSEAKLPAITVGEEQRDATHGKRI